MKYYFENNGEKISEQIGVVRVNCLDCLDRTNVALANYCFASFKIMLQTLQSMNLISQDFSSHEENLF